MSKNIKKKFDEEKKKGAAKPVPKRPIPYSILEERFKAIGKLKGDLTKDCRDLIAQLNMKEKKVFECDAQMRILREMMMGQPKPNIISIVKPGKFKEAKAVAMDKIKNIIEEGQKKAKRAPQGEKEAEMHDSISPDKQPIG